MATQAPDLIGPYRPIRKLGQGGMGVVYCAEDTRDPEHRQVALKVISEGRPATLADDTARRFLREAKILEGLRHPNIVSFYEIGLHGDQSYFAMELLTGSSLRAWVGRAYSDVLPLFIQICYGMEYLAARSIVHRDLSPDNIFVVQDGGRRVAKILDFGIAKDTAEQATLHNFTVTGVLMGKPQYWSPEQIESQSRSGIDWRSDVYALGVIFYFVLSGELPFYAESPAGYITKHLFEAPPDVKAPEGRAEIPVAIVELIRRMLEKDCEARPQSYQEIVSVCLASLGEETRTEVTAFLSTLPPREGPITVTSATVRDDLDTAATSRWERPRAVTAARATAELAFTQQTAAEVDMLPTKTLPLPGSEPTVLQGMTAQVPAAARARRLLPWAGVAAAALVVAGGGVVLLRGRSEPAPAKTAEPTPAAAVIGEPGQLALDALPWARVVSIVNLETGQKVALAGEVTTPVVLVLTPARYAVDLASGVGSETQHVEVDVLAGRVVSKIIPLGPPERILALLD